MTDIDVVRRRACLRMQVRAMRLARRAHVDLRGVVAADGSGRVGLGTTAPDVAGLVWRYETSRAERGRWPVSLRDAIAIAMGRQQRQDWMGHGGQSIDDITGTVLEPAEYAPSHDPSARSARGVLGDKMCGLLSAGYSLRESCGAVGVPYRTAKWRIARLRSGRAPVQGVRRKRSFSAVMAEVSSLILARHRRPQFEADWRDAPRQSTLGVACLTSAPLCLVVHARVRAELARRAAAYARYIAAAMYGETY